MSTLRCPECLKEIALNPNRFLNLEAGNIEGFNLDSRFFYKKEGQFLDRYYHCTCNHDIHLDRTRIIPNIRLEAKVQGVVNFLN